MASCLVRAVHSGHAQRNEWVNARDCALCDGFPALAPAEELIDTRGKGRPRKTLKSGASQDATQEGRARYSLAGQGEKTRNNPTKADNSPLSSRSKAAGCSYEEPTDKGRNRG